MVANFTYTMIHSALQQKIKRGAERSRSPHEPEQQNSLITDFGSWIPKGRAIASPVLVDPCLLARIAIHPGRHQSTLCRVRR